MRDFTLSFQIPLEPQQLVMAGGEHDPLAQPFKTMKAQQYEHSLFHPEEPVLPDVDFLLDFDDEIVPTSPGKRDKINSIFSANCVSGCTKRSQIADRWLS